MKTVFVISFRYTDDIENLIGGDSAFLREILPHLAHAGVGLCHRVVVIGLRYRGTDATRQAGPIKTVRIAVGASLEKSLVEIHAASELEVVRMGQEFGERAFDFVCRNSRPGDLCVLNDFFENGDVRLLKRAEVEVVQLCHLLPSEYVFREYMSDLFSGPKEIRNRFPLWMCLMIEFYRGRIRSHRQLVRFFRMLIRSSLHTLVPRALRQPFVREHESFHLSDRVIVPTSEMKATILKCYPLVPSERVEVVPWGVTRPKERGALAREIKALEKEFGLSEETVALVTLSRISPEKGIEYLLEALKLLEKDDPALAKRTVLFVCGRPTMPRGEDYFEELKRLAGELKLCRVHFPGFVSGDRKSAIFYASDLYVFPSKYESFGLSLVEAMSHGLSVIASDTDGSRDIIKPEFGLRIPFENPAARAQTIQDAILKILDQDLARSGGHARQASERYSWSAVAERVLAAR